MSLWSQLGFSGNPYDVRPLPASEEGVQLLVGRDFEVRTLQSRLRNSSLHPTLEGENGVGKTSLVLVAAYEALEARRRGEQAQLFLPVKQLLQIGPDADAFERSAMYAIAQAFMEYQPILRDAGHAVPDMDELRTWLNDPVLKSGGGSISILGSGGGADVSRATNEGEGFTQSGFADRLKTALQEAFPNDEAGGFVAVIDNLELLQLSNEAKRTLERLRDTTLSLPGVRWVLCGAKGIVRAAVSSPRLTGRIAAPIEVSPIADDVIEQLVQARLDHFSTGAGAKPPVDSAAFRHLYEIGNRNLRDALKYAQDFCIWLDVQGELGRPQEDFRELLEVWLAYEAEQIEAAIRLQPRQWTLFTDLCDAGGSCAPGDYEAFGFASMQRMRSNFAELERAGLVSAEIDEDDHRRRTVAVTSKGWLVRYARSGFRSR